MNDARVIISATDVDKVFKSGIVLNTETIFQDIYSCWYLPTFAGVIYLALVIPGVRRWSGEISTRLQTTLWTIVMTYS